jgi:hypothetical protein
VTVFPTTTLSGSNELPQQAQFWVPTRSEVGEEGFGYFRDTWTICNVSVGDAKEVIATELALARVVSALATTAAAFDRLARMVEGVLDDEALALLTNEERTALEPVVMDEPQLYGLELGVAGLVHALAAVRIWPAASCRGHVSPAAWSEAPVVYFAASAHRAQALVPLVEEVGCRFTLDPGRPDLLVVSGESILATMALADAVLTARSTFVQPRPQRPAVAREPFLQQTLL